MIDHIINELDEAFDKFDARLEELFWKEDEEGILYAGESRNEPDTIVSFRLESEGIEAEEVDVTAAEWRGLSLVALPESQQQSSPQFD
jgi:hypothetical protein